MKRFYLFLCFLLLSCLFSGLFLNAFAVEDLDESVDKTVSNSSSTKTVKPTEKGDSGYIQFIEYYSEKEWYRTTITFKWDDNKPEKQYREDKQKHSGWCFNENYDTLMIQTRAINATGTLVFENQDGLIRTEEFENDSNKLDWTWDCGNTPMGVQCVVSGLPFFDNLKDFDNWTWFDNYTGGYKPGDDLPYKDDTENLSQDKFAPPQCTISVNSVTACANSAHNLTGKALDKIVVDVTENLNEKKLNDLKVQVQVQGVYAQKGDGSCFEIGEMGVNYVNDNENKDPYSKITTDYYDLYNAPLGDNGVGTLNWGLYEKNKGILSTPSYVSNLGSYGDYMDKYNLDFTTKLISGNISNIGVRGCELTEKVRVRYTFSENGTVYSSDWVFTDCIMNKPSGIMNKTGGKKTSGTENKNSQKTDNQYNSNSDPYTTDGNNSGNGGDWNFLDSLAKAFKTIGSIFESITKTFQSITGPNGFVSVLGNFFTQILPAELWALIIATITVICAIGILKAIF